MSESAGFRPYDRKSAGRARTSPAPDPLQPAEQADLAEYADPTPGRLTSYEDTSNNQTFTHLSNGGPRPALDDRNHSVSSTMLNTSPAFVSAYGAHLGQIPWYKAQAGAGRAGSGGGQQQQQQYQSPFGATRGVAPPSQALQPDAVRRPQAMPPPPDLSSNGSGSGRSGQLQQQLPQQQGRYDSLSGSLSPPSQSAARAAQPASRGPPKKRKQVGGRGQHQDARSDATTDEDDDDEEGGGGSGGHQRKKSLGSGVAEDIDDEEDLDDDEKVKRRLAQNREAARKSRQRRKAYVQKLEEEVRQLRWASLSAGKGAGDGAAASLDSLGPAPSLPQRIASLMGSQSHSDGSGMPALPGMGRVGSQGARLNLAAVPLLHPALQPPPSHLARQNADILAAFEKWRGDHLATVLNIRRCLEDPSAASDAPLRLLAEEARTQLWGLFQMKKAVVCSESVLLIVNLEHLHPCERPFAWLGGLRASDAVGGLLHKLANSITALQRVKLEALRESLGQQEGLLGRGQEEVVGELRARAAELPVAGPEAPGLPETLLRCWNSPDILGKLDALRMLLLRADGVWEQYLEEAQRHLALRQYAVAVIAMMEISVQLQHLHLPWLNLLHHTSADAARP